MSDCLFEGLDTRAVLYRCSCTEYGKVRPARGCRKPPRRTSSGDLDEIASIIFLVSWNRGDPEIVRDVLFHAFHSFVENAMFQLEFRESPAAGRESANSVPPFLIRLGGAARTAFKKENPASGARSRISVVRRKHTGCIRHRNPRCRAKTLEPLSSSLMTRRSPHPCLLSA